jgi:HSP20 family molecular chaperone IbpA
MKTRHVKLGILTGTIAAMIGMNPTFAAAPAAPAGQTKEPTTQSSDPKLGERWTDRIFDEFQDMQRRMDRIFNEAAQEEHIGWSDETNFTSSVKVSEDGANYLVRLSLPDRDLSKVDAKVEANNLLRITAQEEKKERTTSTGKGSDQKQTYEMGRYEQLLTLPGPVDASKMKIDRSGSSLTITLPKVEPAAGTK